MKVNARAAGLIAAAVPLAAVVFGAAVIELIPRMIVGGVLVFLGLAFLVEWVWDKRRTLPPVEYGVVLVILAAIIARGFLPGVVLGLVLAVVLFAVSYGRIELVREVSFGETYHSNVDRPPAERAALRAMGDRVQILRLNGFVFFGSANGLLERIRKRVEAAPPRFLVIDLRRVTGVDSSAVVSFVKVDAPGGGERVRARVHRGLGPGAQRSSSVAGRARPRVVRFEPDLDRGLQRCEERLLQVAPRDGVEGGVGGRAVEIGADRVASSDGSSGVLADLPPGVRGYLERVPLAEGTVLIRQDEPPGDVFVAGIGPTERGDGDDRGDADARCERCAPAWSSARSRCTRA